MTLCLRGRATSSLFGNIRRCCVGVPGDGQGAVLRPPASLGFRRKLLKLRLPRLASGLMSAVVTGQGWTLAFAADFVGIMLFGTHILKMSVAAIVIVGYLALGLLIGFVNCAFKTHLYCSHPSSRLVPPDNAVCDFLFRSMFFWPWLVARPLYAALRGSKKGQQTRR